MEYFEGMKGLFVDITTSHYQQPVAGTIVKLVKTRNFLVGIVAGVREGICRNYLIKLK